MRLTHHSSVPITYDPTYAYAPPEIGIYGKPSGLWLSVDDDWRRWCHDARWNEDGFLYAKEFALAPQAKILTIASELELDQFTDQYGTSRGYGSDIDWTRIRAEYDGILIAPYHWGCRLDRKFTWYYGWDCASACIWNLSVLEVVR